MTKTVDILIFDFDGVLVDTGRDIANAANYMLTSFGLAELPPETIIGYIGGGAEPLVRRCLGDQAEDLTEQALARFKQRYADYYFVETGLYPGAREVLAAYHQAGKTMAIATNKVEKLTHGILKGLDIADYFQVVVGPDRLTHRKPHPECIHRILEEIGAEPHQAVMIGDTAADLQAGRAAGTLTVGATYGYGKLAEIQAAHPDFIIDDIRRLPDIIT